MKREHNGISPTAPPDRGGLLTEQRLGSSRDLDRLSVRACVALINGQDATVPGAVSRVMPSICEFIEAAERGMAAGGRLVYIGAGTSGRLGVLDAAECPPTFQSEPGEVVGVIAGGDDALRRSSERREDERDGAWPELERLAIEPRDTVLGVAAGGTTPYVLGALEEAKRRGASTGLLVCTPVERPVWVDTLIGVETGAEVLTGSTRMKAGTATKLVLNTISTTLMVRRGKVYENLMVDLRATNGKLVDRGARVISEVTGLGRAPALALLDRAGGHVKTAIAMHLLGADRNDAARALDDAGGRLRTALDRGDTGG